MKISYNKNEMSLSLKWTWKGVKHYKYLACPFAMWWKARKYFKRPKFKVYFGPIFKKGKWYEGNEELGIKPGYIYNQIGYYPFASTEYVKRNTSKWFPVFISSSDVMWKDKYGEPQYERPGYFTIIFGRDYHKAWQFLIMPKALYHNYTFIGNNGNLEIHNAYADTYYEMLIWFNYYTKKDIRETFNTFPKGHVYTNCRQNIDNHDISNIEETTIDGENFIKLTLNNLKINIYDYASVLDFDDYISIVLRPKEKDSKDIFCHSSYIKVNSYDKTITCFFKYDDGQNIINNINEINEITYYHKYTLYDTWVNEFLTKKAIREIKQI